MTTTIDAYKRVVVEITDQGKILRHGVPIEQLTRDELLGLARELIHVMRQMK